MMRIWLVLFLFVVTPIHAETVSINHASVEEIARHLTGVGLKKARAIVDYRKKHGFFKSPQQLLNVKGIGKKTLAANLAKISLKKQYRNTSGVTERQDRRTNYIIGP